MKILNKQKLEQEIRSLFRELHEAGPAALTEDRFNQGLSGVLEKNELETVEEEERIVSVMIADIRGFTPIVEKYDSATVIRILNVFFGTMVKIVDHHGGHVNKFMGDSLIAYFDIGDDIQESVLNVLHCAIDMQIAMDEVNAQGARLGMDNLYMGIGINTGEVVASVLGSDIYREYTMIGSTVNLASRIEAYTLRGQILMSEYTWQYVCDQVETGQVNEVGAKGMREPLRFYELQAIKRPDRIGLPKRENRRAPRIRVRIPVYFQMLEGKNILPDVYEGEVVDISYGGMLITATSQVEPFSDLKMSVSLSPFISDPVDIYAKALYVQSLSEGAEIGLEFTIIDDATSATVKNFVDSLI